MRTRLEFGGAMGGGMSFYEVETHGKEVAVRTGEVGKEEKAKEETATCKSEAEAEKKAAELLQEKVKTVFTPGDKQPAIKGTKGAAPAPKKK